MTNTKTTKRSLFSSVVALLLCFSMLLGTTYAWFTDTAASNGNKIVAGELDVELQMYDGSNYINIGDSKQPIFGVNSIAEQQIAQNNNADTLWEPGKTQVAYLAIKNDGNLDLKYTVALRVFGVKNDLYKVMKYAIIPDAHPNTAPVNAWDATKGKSVVEGTQTVSDGDVFLANRQTHYFALVIHMDENATNEYQNGEINFDLTVLATQVSSESDSFGNTYDENATYPTIIQVTKPVEAASDSTSKEEVTFSQVAEDSAISKVEVTVPAGAKLKNYAEELVLTVTEVKDANPDIVIYASEQATTYNINIQGIDSDEVNGNTTPIEITLYIEKGLSGVKLYHHDELITSTYNATTGALSFSTATFSPFTVVHEKVGGSADVDDSTIYVDSAAKLVAAFNTVKDGDTIILTNDVTFDESSRTELNGYYEGVNYAGDQSFTVDLNGKTITHDSAVNDYLIRLENNGSKANTIVFKNGIIEAGPSAYCAIATASSNTQTITIDLENVSLIGNNSWGAVTKIRGGSVLNVKDGTVITGKDSYVGIECVGTNTVTNIYEGAKIYQNGKTNYVGSLVGVSYGGTVHVYGGSGTSATGGFIAMTSGGTINIYGGEWIANTDGTPENDNSGILIAQNDKKTYAGAGNSIVNVFGGTFKGGYNCYGNAVGDAQINITAGTFNADPSNYVSTGYKAICEDGVYSIIEDKSAALTAAINAGETTITLDAGYYTMPNVQNKNIVLIGAGLETIVDYSHMGGYQEVSGSSFVFKNMTLKVGNSYTKGLQHTVKVTYENCHLIGWQGLYADEVEFTNCTLDSNGGEHCVWTYGADKITFTNCAFTYADRAVNCFGYETDDDVVTFNDCTFNFVEDDHDVTGAIEINSNDLNSLTITINNCSANKGDLWWISEWDTKNHGAKTRVYVDGELTVNTGEHLRALAAKAEGEITIVLGQDITLGTEVQKSMGAYFPNATKVIIDGRDHTLTLKGQMEGHDWHDEYYAGIIAPNAEVTVKNLTIVNNKLCEEGIAYSADRESVYTFVRGTNVLYENVKFDGGVQVKNDTKFVNCSFEEDVLVATDDGKYAKNGMFCVFIDFQYNATATCEVTFENCDFNASGYGCVKVAGDKGAKITVNVEECTFENTCLSNSWSTETPKYDIKKSGIDDTASNITVNDLGSNTWSVGANAGIGIG